MDNPFNNPDFREEMSKLLDEKLGPIITKVDAHETIIQQAKGARWTFAALWSVLVIVAEWVFHRH